MYRKISPVFDPICPSIFFLCNGGNAMRDFENGHTSAVQVAIRCRKERLNIIGMHAITGTNWFHIFQFTIK
jgi:hypothetical protein